MIKRTDLLKTTVGDAPAGSDLELASYTTELPAGYEIAPHRHTYSTVGYVLEGRFQLAAGDGAAKEYVSGECFTEPAGVVVTGRAVEATKLYMVLARQPGQPEARPA